MSENKTYDPKNASAVHSSHATDVQEFISDLDAGLFEQKLGIALSDVAAGVVDFDAIGEVTVNFKIKRIGDSAAVVVAHKLTSKRPTSKGDRTETDTTTTPMYIGPGGKMTVYPLGSEVKDLFSE